MQSYDRILNWIRALIGTRFPNKNKLAQELGLKSASQLYDTLDGKRSPKAETFVQWLDALGVSLLLPDEARKLDSEFYPVPKVSVRLAGSHGGSVVYEDRIEGFYAFKYEWLSQKSHPSDCVLMGIVGESMEPTLNEGDMVLIDQSQTDPYTGKLYAVAIEGQAVVKRLEKLPGKLLLRSDHPSYEPVTIDTDKYSDVRIIGRVIWAAREFK